MSLRPELLALRAGYLREARWHARAARESTGEAYRRGHLAMALHLRREAHDVSTFARHSWVCGEPLWK